MPHQVRALLVTLLFLVAAFAVAQGVRNIGEVTALIPEASTATLPSQSQIDGASGDTDFPFIASMKPLATVGEVDAETGHALTGYPDGHAAWLVDEDTVRIAYQSESYGPMSSETYAWAMANGATFTGSHIHTIDYDRAGLADLLSSSLAAVDIVGGSGHLFDTVYNVFGEEVVAKADGGLWGNQATPDRQLVEFAPGLQLTEADFFFQSFCGAYYELPEKYGAGIGFVDHLWFTAEEWNIQNMFDVSNGQSTLSFIDTADTMGLASVVVDIANGTAYTVPALGQSGYEKLLPINPGHADYVVIVLAGYNHEVEPAPLRIFVGRKGLDADGTPIAADAPERDQFLARNGLLFGRIYGMALANETFAELGIDIDLEAKMLDAYLTNPDAPDTVAAVYAPTSYQWGGWDAPVAVRDTDTYRWGDPAEQPAGHTYFVGDSKVEHPAVDPDPTRQRFVQNMTNEGALIAIDVDGLAEAFAQLDGALPATIPATVTRIVPAVDGALALEVGDKGVKHGGEGTAATWEDGSAMMVAPDGLHWIKTADADILIVDEDSGNDFGERKYALVLDPATLQLTTPNLGYFLAMAGGASNPRAANGVSAYGGAFSRATTSEFSGTWNVTALLTRKADGSFYTMEELAGTGMEAVNASVSTNESLLIGVVQHRSESGGPVAEVKADNGGQLFLYSLALPVGMP